MAESTGPAAPAPRSLFLRLPSALRVPLAAMLIAAPATAQQQKQSIVPFVESATVLATLWQAGVSYIQGHYLQGPSQSMDYDFASDEE